MAEENITMDLTEVNESESESEEESEPLVSTAPEVAEEEPEPVVEEPEPVVEEPEPVVEEPEPEEPEPVVEEPEPEVDGNTTQNNNELEGRVIVLEEKLEKLINIFKVTGYRKIIDFNNINVVDVKYGNINERYEAYVDLLNLFITEINKIIKIDLIEKKSITFLKELEEHLQKVINITGSLGQWNKDYFS